MKQDFVFQLNIFKQFCNGWDIDDTIYEVEEIRNKYFHLWNDFVSIRINLIDGKLKEFLYNTLNVPLNQIEEFYKYFEYHKTFGTYLPINCEEESTLFNFNESLFKMNAEFNKFGHNNGSNSTKEEIKDIYDLNHIYRFVVIYNGLLIMLNKYDKIKRRHGITRGIILNEYNNNNYNSEMKEKEKEKEKEKDNNNDDSLLNNLCLLISNYICDQCAQTGIFGTYHDRQEKKLADWKIAKITEQNIKTFNVCKELLFDNNFNELIRLVKYCLTSNISNINHYINSIKTNDDAEDTYIRSVVSIMATELSFIIFHDLTMNGKNNNSDNKNKNTRLLLYPKLLKVFKFIYNLSCYIYCYPFHVGQSQNEAFYISQYFDLKNTLFKDIFDNTNNKNNSNQKQEQLKAGQLAEYNYFCQSYFSDGTLLHKACYARSHCRYYSEILIKDGFDINKRNRAYDYHYRKSPYVIAKERKIDEATLLLMEKQFRNMKKQAQISNMKTIENECDLLFKQIMFGKYFLICCGINVNDNYQIKKHRSYQSDELYYQLNSLAKGLSVITTDKKDGINAVNTIISAVNKLIDTKMVISDELLILSWIYGNSSNDNNNKNNNDNNNNHRSSVLDNLLKCVSECLSGKTDHSTRSYLYFKQFLLHSNIWYCKDYKNDKLLFDYVNELADKLLMEQKKYLKQSFENEEKKDGENWNKLCNFSKYGNKQQLRQDTIPNGIKLFKTTKNTYSIACQMENPDYNVLSEFNDKVYLTQCLTFANENKPDFDSTIKEMFKDCGTVRQAPVKLYDRCLVKSS